MKILTILRGLPGAGKSTRAKELRDKGALIISNDDYFTDAATGKYRFDRARLPDAVQSCRLNVLLAMKKGAEHIVIDNCFIYKNPITVYYDAAFRHGYRVEVEMIGGTEEKDVETYFARNVHGVPKTVIADMARKFEK